MKILRAKDATWREWKLYYISKRHKANAEAWESMTDDRKLYSNIYHMIVRAIESLPDEPDNYICVAMDRQIDNDLDTMDEIVERFKSI